MPRPPQCFLLMRSLCAGKMPALPVMFAVKRYDTYVYSCYLLMGDICVGSVGVSKSSQPDAAKCPLCNLFILVPRFFMNKPKMYGGAVII